MPYQDPDQQRQDGGSSLSVGPLRESAVPRGLGEAAAALLVSRRQERERGHDDGVAFAPTLGWAQLERLAEHNFELKNWFESLCNGWHDILTGRTPDDAATATWLPELADMFGTYLDPTGDER